MTTVVHSGPPAPFPAELTSRITTSPIGRLLRMTAVFDGQRFDAWYMISDHATELGLDAAYDDMHAALVSTFRNWQYWTNLVGNLLG